ncbi:ParA family protein [Pseudoalteromonas sp. J010]|nr:ParA family protein [Pseudoalteromonas peptidolytica]RRS09128.1 ParA family protein [Pseudoalteromonas sp. J010]RXF05535.1 ParA family protein [Pseudoalteromonas sp. PS5]
MEVFMSLSARSFRLAQIPVDSRAKIVSVANRKGGVGKTTLVSYLGEGIALWAGKRVLLIDTDKQCNLSGAYGVIESTTVDAAHAFAGSALRAIHQPIIHPEYYDEDGNPMPFAARSSSSEIMKEDRQYVCQYGTYIQHDSPHLGTVNKLGGMLDIVPGDSEALSHIHTHAEKYPARTLYERWESWLIDCDILNCYDLIIFDTPPLDAELNEALYQLSDHVIVPVNPSRDTLGSCNTVTMSCLAANNSDGRMRLVTTIVNPLNSGKLSKREEILLEPIFNYPAFGCFPKNEVFPRSRLIQERRDISVPPYIDPESFEKLSAEEKRAVKPPMSSLIWNKKSDPSRKKLFSIIDKLHQRIFGEPLPPEDDN